MGGSIRLLSGGAAQGLVEQLKARLRNETGFDVQGTFGAVGAMKDKLLAGEPCDIVILTQALIDQLTSEGQVVAGSATPLGIVRTGIAVKSGATAPDVSTAAALKSVLLGAHGVYFPDPIKATAGIHFMKVLHTLGIAGELGARLHTYPNGATAMREMAQSKEIDVVGCTQVTEILFAPGVELVGLLPKEFELATVYTAGICTRAQSPQASAKFIAMLASEHAAPMRSAAGFGSA